MGGGLVRDGAGGCPQRQDGVACLLRGLCGGLDVPDVGVLDGADYLAGAVQAH